MEKKSVDVQTVTNLYSNRQLNFVYGRYNILDCGVRTGKTYWAVKHLTDFTRDGKAGRILFLVDTLALKDSIVAQYGESCCDADYMWEKKTGEWSVEELDKIGVMCYQTLGMRCIRDELDFLENIDVICWDECDSIFDFAATAFARARKNDFSRQSSTNAEILALIQQHSSKRDYMPLILLGKWEQIVNENRILCIGLSATPGRARAYYDSLTSESYKGKIQTTYRAATDIYFKNVIDHVKNLTPVPGIGYWCYSPSIENNKSIVAAANNRGFHAIEIHSQSNTDKPLTEEQKEVINCITQLHVVPYGYDFVVITRAFERGLDIVDPRFMHLIVDSYYQVDRIQAARQTFPYQRHVKVLGGEVPEEYKDRWLTTDECRALAEQLAIPDINLGEKKGKSVAGGRLMSWNRLQQILPSMGYTIEKKRRRVVGNNATICYRITGDWHDVELVADGDFMTLAAAKNEQLLLDNGNALLSNI